MPASDPVVQPASGIRVLVVEDQADIAANIWDFLERRGYLVDHAADGAAGLARALHGAFDVIVLDLGLPRLDGLALCRKLRDAGHGVPVLMLTARDTLDDKLRGYAEGADDYMVKPFAMRELEARIRVLHRGNLAAGADRLALGPLAYDAGAMLAMREGVTVALTRKQGALLSALMQASPRVLSHQALIRAAWNDGNGETTSLHSLLYELRGLVDRPFGVQMIQSVRGIGYRMVAP